MRQMKSICRILVGKIRTEEKVTVILDWPISNQTLFASGGVIIFAERPDRVISKKPPTGSSSEKAK
jgi:hypothetical protein